MTDGSDSATYIGQVEMDPAGALWAVLYHGETVVGREQVRSLRRGKRRVADMVLSAADNFPEGCHRSAPTALNRIVTQPSRARRRHLNTAAV